MTHQPIEPQPPTRRQLTSLAKRPPRPVSGTTTTGTPPKASPPRRAQRSTVSAVFYLPVSLAQAFSERVKQEKTTNGDLALDAVEATIDQLPQLLAKPEPEETGGLFARPRTVTAEKTTQVTGYFIRSNRDTLDDLAAKHDCSRSALLTACLRAYLSR